jgi:hypothetical protein
MKIKIVSAIPDHPQLGPILRKTVRSYLEDLGITFVDNNPDAILYHTYKAGPDQKKILQEEKIPIFILERIAAAKILSRQEIFKDNVIAILKDTIYRDISLNNLGDPKIANCPEYEFKTNYHSSLILDSLKKQYEIIPPKQIIPSKLLTKKIRLWYSFASYDMMGVYINNNVLWDQKPIDVSFWGTTSYGEHALAVTLHRKQCINELKKLTNIKVDYSDQRVKGKDKYIECLRNSKIGLSPWGLGEKCYRDFEVLYAGGALIKPDTSFVKDWIDFYDINKKFYFPCRIDHTDLKEITEYILQNWNTIKEVLANNRNKLIELCFDEKLIANHVKEILKI